MGAGNLFVTHLMQAEWPLGVLFKENKFDF